MIQNHGQTGFVDNNIDLDAAEQQIAQRRVGWRRLGIVAGETTWRECDGWPHRITTDRATVADVDSIGVELTKGTQLGIIVLFAGGWADFMFYNGVDDGIGIVEAPGWNDPLDVGRFGQLLDRLTKLFS